MLKLAVVSKTPWSEIVDSYLLEVKATLKPRTAHSYTAQLRIFSAWIIERGVTPEEFKARDLNAYLVHRETNGVSRTTRRYDAIVIRSMLRHATREEYIERDPLKDYKIPNAPTVEQYCPTPADITKLFQAISGRWDATANPPIRFVPVKERTFYRRRDTAIVVGLVETACRIGELLDLDRADVDEENRTLLFQQTKTDRPRKVPFGNAFAAALAEWKKVRPRCESDRLFVSAYGDNLSVCGWEKSFRIYRDMAGLPQFHPHSCRHYAITEMTKVDIVAAAKLAGHNDIRTTQGYSHADEKRVRAAHTDANLMGGIIVNKRSEANETAKRRKKLV